MGDQIPDKRYFRIGEVSSLTGLEAHVIRYWEKEFPKLKPLRADSRQRLYTQADLRLIMDIRRLLHEERYTIAGAKKVLSSSQSQNASPTQTVPPASPLGRMELVSAQTIPDKSPVPDPPFPSRPIADSSAPERPAPDSPTADRPAQGAQSAGQADLPLFPEEFPAPAPKAEQTDLLQEIRQELGRIARILS